jgi:drug/metabolite transporter (DMT)-like permease
MGNSAALSMCCEDASCCSQPPPSNLVRRLQQASLGLRASRQLRAGLPVVAMLAAVSLWGPSFVATKLALREIPPFTIAFLRFFVATCFLYPVWWLSNERDAFSMSGRRYLFLGGLLGVAMYFFLENLGVQLTTASDAALLMAAIPVISLLAEVVWFKQDIPWRRGLGIAISILGVFLVIGQAPALGGRGRLLGDLLVMTAAFCWAAYGLLGKSLSHYPKLTVVAHQTMYGALMLLPLALLEIARWRGLSWVAGLSILYLGLMCSTVTYLLYNYALKALTAGQVSAFLNLVPVIGVITAMIVLGEQIQLVQILGGGVIVAGVAISTRN